MNSLPTPTATAADRPAGLGCGLDYAIADWAARAVTLHVPATHAPDMSGALRYASVVLPGCRCVYVLETPTGHPVITYRWDADAARWLVHEAWGLGQMPERKTAVAAADE